MKTSTLLGTAIAAAQILALPFATLAGDTSKEVTTAKTTTEKAPPLPLHTIDGVGGVVITPIAYLVNPGPEGTIWGLPSASVTYVKANTKNVESAVITETLFGRLELGYAPSRFGVGNLVDDVRSATKVTIKDDVILHNFNARFLAVKENSYDLPLPAITLEAQYKYNDGIGKINDELKFASVPAGVLSSIGYKRDDGVDFVATATKAFPKVFWRPLIVSVGVRFSEAEQLGYLGFGDTYKATFEGNVVYLITDHIGLAGEFRGKAGQYNQVPYKDGKFLIGKEDNWWTLGAAYIFNAHASVTVGYGNFGQLLNTREDKGIAFSAKYEF